MDPEHKPRGTEEAPGRKKLLQELTRRHVVQVALLYFAVVWTFTEVLTFLLGAIPLFPAWSETLGDNLPPCVANMRAIVM